MKLTASVKLITTKEQADLLLQTLHRANEACNDVSAQAWETRTFNQFRLHKLVYRDVRERFDLSAQVTVRIIGKVADAYKKDKKTQRAFKPTGAAAYDSRVLTWYVDKREVSIWTLEGRIKLSFVCGQHQAHLLQYQQGESDLIYRKGTFYLFTTCDVPDEQMINPEGTLGVDLGLANIATDSDGNIRSGKRLKNVRHRYQRLRAKLQRKGTKSAKRLLKKRSGKERRFRNDVNHCISKQLVKTAKDTQRQIALEDLSGIRDRVTVRRAQRYQLHSWSFFDLRLKLGYKALMSGVPVVYVDPRNTSRQCSVCAHIDKASRKSQSVFVCTSCGHAAHADVNAAINIGRRGSVNAPYAVGVEGF